MKKALSLIFLFLFFVLITCVHAQIGNGWQTGNGWQGVATPTPTPSLTPSPTPGITADDAMGVAVAFGIMAISLAIVMPIIFMRRKQEQE